MKKLFPKKFQYTNVKKGFTLIETLVAITVLMLAVTGPLVISQKGLSAAGYAKDQMIAYYLAQDAMEYVRNVRDTNIVRGVVGIGEDWLSAVSVGSALSSCNNENCTIDTVPLSGVSPSGCSLLVCPLKKNDRGNFEFQYGHGSGVSTQFSRTVKIEKPVGGGLVLDDAEAKVTVTVSWPTPSGQAKNVTLVENLFKQN